MTSGCGPVGGAALQPGTDGLWARARSARPRPAVGWVRDRSRSVGLPTTEAGCQGNRGRTALVHGRQDTLGRDDRRSSAASMSDTSSTNRETDQPIWGLESFGGRSSRITEAWIPSVSGGRACLPRTRSVTNGAWNAVGMAIWHAAAQHELASPTWA